MSHRSAFPGVGRILALLLAASMAQVPAMPASGQVTAQAPGLDAALRPDFERRDLALFSRNLSLDGTQRDILEALYADYEAAFRAGVAELRRSLAEQVGVPLYDTVAREEGEKAFRQRAEEAIRTISEAARDMTVEERRAFFAEEAGRLREQSSLLGGGPPREPAELRAAAEATADRVEQWRRDKAALADEMRSGLLAVLSEEQQERWPGVLRQLRKMKTLSDGRLSGESVDVRALARPLLEDADTAPAVEPILERYDLELDAALAARDRYVSEHQHDLALALVADDVNAAGDILRGESELRVRVRDLNERFVEEIAAAVPPEAADDLRHRYEDRAWARVYRLTRGQRVYRSIREQLELSAEDAAALEAMHADYLARLAALNAQVVAVLRETEPGEQVRQMQRRLGVEPAPGDPARSAFEPRSELDQAFVEQVAALLTPEQAARVPGLAPAAADGAADTTGADPRTLPTLSQRWRRLIEMFDEDGDGRLENGERDKALRFLRSPPEAEGG